MEKQMFVEQKKNSAGKALFSGEAIACDNLSG